MVGETNEKYRDKAIYFGTLSNMGIQIYYQIFRVQLLFQKLTAIYFLKVENTND
jgi:hypothetical protein